MLYNTNIIGAAVRPCGEGLLPLLKYPNNGVYNDLCGLGCNTSLFGGYIQPLPRCTVIRESCNTPLFGGYMQPDKGNHLIQAVVIHPYLEGIYSYPYLYIRLECCNTPLFGGYAQLKQKPLIKILWKKHY